MKRLATMTLVCLTLAALSWSPAALAQPLADEQTEDAPATQPAAGDAGESEATSEDSVRDGMLRPYGRPWMGRGGWGGGGVGVLGEITDEEWINAAEFMRENSPNRWRLFERLSDGSDGSGRRRGPVIRMIIARYRNLQSVKEEDQSLYDLRVQQLKLDDEIWRIVRDMRRSSTDEQREELRANLRAKVTGSVDVWMKEREHRLSRLEETLKRERELLNADRARHESMVENRLQREMERIPDFMAFPRPAEPPQTQ